MNLTIASAEVGLTSTSIWSGQCVLVNLTIASAEVGLIPASTVAVEAAIRTNVVEAAERTIKETLQNHATSIAHLGNINRCATTNEHLQTIRAESAS